MIDRNAPLIITGTSPATATKSVIGSLGGLGRYDSFLLTASLLGGTGGTLDITIQRRVTSVAPYLWVEWARFTQLTAGNAAVNYSLSSLQSPSGLVATGLWADDLSTGALTLATNTFVGGHPGDWIRLVASANASTSAGAVQTLYVTPIKTIS